MFSEISALVFDKYEYALWRTVGVNRMQIEYSLQA